MATQKIATVTTREDATACGNALNAGTYRVSMPADYDPALVTGADILCDDAMWIVDESTAERIADELGNDGMVFEAADGRTLQEMCEAEGASEERARVAYDEDGEEVVVEVSRGEQIYDRVRYGFADGSAIVVAGTAWDIEGAAPFSWAE